MILLGKMTVVFPPKSVPSTATASQLIVRNPCAAGRGAPPLSAPPIAALKAFSAVSAPPDELVPPTPEKLVWVTLPGGFPSLSGGSAAKHRVVIINANAANDPTQFFI